jgi:hypothetical protein
MTLGELVEAFTSRWDIPDLDIIKELKRRLPQIEAAVELAVAELRKFNSYANDVSNEEFREANDGLELARDAYRAARRKDV